MLNQMGNFISGMAGGLANQVSSSTERIINKSASSVYANKPKDVKKIATLTTPTVAKAAQESSMLKGVNISASASQTSSLKPAHARTIPSKPKPVDLAAKDAKHAEVFKKVKESLANTKDPVLIDQLMAKLSYCPELKKEQDENENIIKTGLGDFKVDAIIENKRGLRAVCLVPIKEGTTEVDPSKPQVISFRGTKPTNLGNIRDDFGFTVGGNSFAKSKKDIEALIAGHSGGSKLVGHSLGGALAQLAAAEFVSTGNVRQVCHYNAPGVGWQAASKYKMGLRELKADQKPPIVTNTYVRGDIIRHGGGIHLPTTERVILEVDKKTSTLASHKMQLVIDQSSTLSKDGALGAIEEGPIGKEHSTAISLAGHVAKVSVELGRLAISPLVLVIVKTAQLSGKAISALKRTFHDYRCSQIQPQVQQAMRPPLRKPLPPPPARTEPQFV